MRKLNKILRTNKTDGNDIKYKNLKQTLSETTGNV